MTPIILQFAFMHALNLCCIIISQVFHCAKDKQAPEQDSNGLAQPDSGYTSLRWQGPTKTL